MNKKFYLYISFTLLLSIYSFAIGQWKVFPFQVLVEIRKHIASITEKPLYIQDANIPLNPMEIRTFGLEIPVVNARATEVLALNNFNFE